MVHDPRLGEVRWWRILVISLSYALAFAVAGGLLWRNKGLKVPGGLLVTSAVCMTPLAVYGFERVAGAWLQGVPGHYAHFLRLCKRRMVPDGGRYGGRRLRRLAFLPVPVSRSPHRLRAFVHVHGSH